MSLSYYAARANLYYLRQHHPDWSHAELAAALDRSVSWVEKWLKRIRCELAAGELLEHMLQGHSRARKTPPSHAAAAGGRAGPGHAPSASPRLAPRSRARGHPLL